MKQAVCVLLAAVMLFSAAACGDKDEAFEDNEYEYTTGYDETKYNAPGEFPIFKDRQTITVMLPDSAYVEDWDTNYQTLTTEKDLN